MGLLLLSASQNTSVKITATGDKAEAALEALASLIERRFDEED